MTIIKAEVDVFPDPEYCEDTADKKDYDQCNYMNSEDENCFLFGKELDFDWDAVRFIKCDQCKAAYQISIISTGQNH